MAYQFGISRATDNKLFTLRGRKLPNGSQQILLMGFIEMKKRVDSTVGWVFLISGNPLIPHENDEEYPNKIGLDKVHVTWNQREAILESSIFPDGFVYLYGGKFRVARCKNSDKCEQHNSNILHLLGEKLNKFEVTLDTERVVPFRRSLIERVTMHTGGMYTFGEIYPNPENRQEQSETDEKFIFWGNERQSSVEIKCPAKHTGYLVEVYLIQRHIYKCMVKDSCRPRRETDVLEHGTVLVHPSCNKKGCVACGHDHDEGMQRVQSPLKIFALPEAGKEIHPEGILEKYRVKRVEYWGVARLLKNGDWKEMTVAKLLVRKPVKVVGLKKPVTGGEPSGGYHIYQNVTASSKGENKGPNEDAVVESSGFSNCSISVTILILELELFDEIKM